MELKDKIHIRAPRERVFAALNDVEVLQAAIPGCEEIEATGENSFAATITSKVGPLKARFKGNVTLSDIVVPESYTLTGEGKAGPVGHAKIRSQIRLSEDGAQGTVLDYEVKADIAGKLAQLGGTIVEKTSKKLAAQFFDSLQTILGAEDDAGVTVEEEEVPAEAGNRTWLWICGVALIIMVITLLAF